MSLLAEPKNRSRLNQNHRQPLGERLIQEGIISASMLEQALREQSTTGRRLGETLIALGLANESDLLPFMAEGLGFKATRLREGLIDPSVVHLIPQALAKHYKCLALFKVRNELTVAMVEPQNLEAIDHLRRITKLSIRPILVLPTALERLVDRSYEADFSVDTVTADFDDREIQVGDEENTINIDHVEIMAEGSPVVNLVNFLLLQGVRQGASDIHIEPGLKNCLVRFRVDGQLREVLKPRADIHAAAVSRIKVMSKMDIAEQRKPQDGRFHARIDNRTVDFRVSTLPTVQGEKVVMRILDRASISFDLDRLGVPEDQLGRLKTILRRPHGLVLVTGPTGSGKTTTLYSSVEMVKNVSRNIITVEDPVEYQLELINQVQVQSSRNMTFASALRSILRQDPDVILVGEIRDVETAETAIQAALTGHLVLSTLHTNDTASTITRLVDMGIAPFKISAALAGIVAQRLVRRVCSNCKTSHFPSAEMLKMVGYHDRTRQQFSRGQGCPQCHDTGFRGRRGIYEILEVNHKVRQLIQESAPLDQIREELAAQGGGSLLSQALRLADDGITALDEVIRVAHFE
ncbi:MAG: Flp pilus assembly complex ATPase component TadA [Planctomycetaceae bacterium]|nr:Flp pilus assembly complex ATPase component TadA [Planctomycetaceae bacterium]